MKIMKILMLLLVTMGVGMAQFQSNDALTDCQTPEPAAWMLIGTGLVAAGVLKFRRRG